MKLPRPEYPIPSLNDPYLMLDIETMSTRIADCPVCQISCIYIEDPSKTDPFFAPKFDSKVAFSMEHVDPKTLLWHMKQDVDRTQEYVEIASDSKRRSEYDERSVLEQLSAHIRAWSARVENEDIKALSIWCRGTNFDIPILEERMHVAAEGLRAPWKYYKVRDARTLIETVQQLDPTFELPERDNESCPPHDSLYDCIYQAQVHNACLAKLAEIKEFAADRRFENGGDPE